MPHSATDAMTAPDAVAAAAARHPAWFTLRMSPTPSARVRAVVRAALAPALTAAIAVGYVGVDLSGALTEDTPGPVPALVHGALVLLQAVALGFARRAPLGVLAAVVGLDLVILATSAGELGIGAFAVMIAVYAAIRHTTSRRAAYTAVGVGAVLVAAVGAVGIVAAGMPVPTAVLVAVVNVLVLAALPAALAEYMLGRERLAQALRQQAESAERARRAEADRELRAERAALARELHDIAGHHLSGIIVSAQAAAALTDTDPSAARTILQDLQQNARTALTDLRRTVGLLRTETEPMPGPGAPATPTVAEIPALVEAARARGQQVRLERSGEPRPVGPLAETAAYRMVQESLANAARHARGAECRVRIAYLPDEVEVEVWNSLPVDTPPAGPGDGYGIAGMRERADLVGGTLESGQGADGWRNRLRIPTGTGRGTR